MSAVVTPFKYKVFLSYSHHDKKWGEWLHRALENYKIDKDLVGRQTPAGSVPKTLRPIFRDRDDFAAGYSLTEQTVAALEASQFLIVICSPRAATSPYVNEEIRRFKAMGRAERVIAIIIDGQPGDAEQECFPAALRRKVRADGALTDEREEPIAADARPAADGREMARQKVVAGILGVDLDEIARRAERAARKRFRTWVASLAFLTIGFAAITVWAELNRREAETQRNEADRQRIEVQGQKAEAEANRREAETQRNEADRRRIEAQEQKAEAERNFDVAQKAANALVFDIAQGLQEQEGLKTETVKKILDQAERAFFRHSLRAQTRMYNCSVIRPQCMGYSRAPTSASAYREPAQVFTDPLEIIKRIVEAEPANRVWQRDLAVAYQNYGDAHHRLGGCQKLWRHLARTSKSRNASRRPLRKTSVCTGMSRYPTTRSVACCLRKASLTPLSRTSTKTCKSTKNFLSSIRTTTNGCRASGRRKFCRKRTASKGSFGRRVESFMTMPAL